VDKLIVNGPCSLKGEVKVSGSKNAALPILAASILASEKVVLGNIPFLRDITTMLELLSRLNVSILIDESMKIEIDSSSLNNYKAHYEIVKTMRASILVLGPMLARYGEAYVSMPGGCAIGSRPVDIHIECLKQLGAEIELTEGYIAAKAKGGLVGANIKMPKVSVGATENIMMAAVLAKGTTTIEGAAVEPEVTDLANFLVAIGADITGIGTSTLVIEGKVQLGGGSYEVISDRIEAGTFLIAAAMTKGRVTVNDVQPANLKNVLEMLEQVGADITIKNNSITLDMHHKNPKAISVSTAPYPGFPTDLQAQWVALCAISNGTSEVVENVFENRFAHIGEMVRMGANIKIEGKKAIVSGVSKLRSAPVMATDLRASASLVLAGLVADGMTVIDRIYHIDRGYMHIEEKFAALGAKIKRISTKDSAPDE
jgi:UDP-N-acetylglucosamine 1-carboxyvinyltransferase